MPACFKISFSLLFKLCLLLSLTFVGQIKGAVVLVDFGPTATTGAAQTWNNITAFANGSVSNLLDSAGNTTGFSIAITSAFEAGNAEGTTASALFPSNATVDTFYSSSAFGSSSRLVLSNLNPLLTYDLSFFASIIRETGERNTRYTVTGSSAAQFVELSPLNNTSNTVGLMAISPNASNQIIIDVSRGTGNTSSPYFLGLIRIETHAVPEPSRVLLLGLGAVVLCGQRRRFAANV